MPRPAGARVAVPYLTQLTRPPPRLDCLLCLAARVLTRLLQGFYARPQKKEDGTLNIMVWEVGIPGKEGVSWDLPAQGDATDAAD